MNLLITAFEPFGGRDVNASLRVLEKLNFSRFAELKITTAVLPVRHQTAASILVALIDQWLPDVTICMGEAGGRPQISLERVAINYADYRIHDNGGVQVSDEMLVNDAPSAYFSSLPLRKSEQRIKAAGIPVEISLSAGSYLCNEVFFHLMHKLASCNENKLGGFIHLPYLPQEVVATDTNAASMAEELTTEGVSIVIEECAALLRDNARM